MLIPFRPRLEDTSEAGTDARLERVTRGVRTCRIRSRALSFEIAELVRQFVEDDLRFRSGRRKGERLGKDGRGERMQQLGTLHRAYWRNRDKESWLLSMLASLEGDAPETGRESPGAPTTEVSGDSFLPSRDPGDRG